MGGDGPKALAFPVAFPEVPAFLVEIQSTRNEAHHNLGLPHLTNWVDGLGECDFWAYEYRCGLQVVYQFLHDGQGGSALADSPEVNHVIRHSPFRQDLCFPITQEGLNLELDRLRSERQKLLYWMHSRFNGQMTMATPTRSAIRPASAMPVVGPNSWKVLVTSNRIGILALARPPASTAPNKRFNPTCAAGRFLVNHTVTCAAQRGLTWSLGS